MNILRELWDVIAIGFGCVLIAILFLCAIAPFFTRHRRDVDGE